MKLNIFFTLHQIKAILLIFVMFNSISIDIARKVSLAKKNLPKIITGQNKTNNHNSKKIKRKESGICKGQRNLDKTGWSCDSWATFLNYFVAELNGSGDHRGVSELENIPECSIQNIVNTINQGDNVKDIDQMTNLPTKSLFNRFEWTEYISRGLATVKIINKCYIRSWWEVAWKGIVKTADVVTTFAVFIPGLNIAAIAFKIAAFVLELYRLFSNISTKCPTKSRTIFELKEDPVSRGTCFGFLMNTFLKYLPGKKRKHKKSKF